LDVLRLGTFCILDVLGLGRVEAWTFCSWDVLQLGHYVFGHFVFGTFCCLDVMSLDVLYVHLQLGQSWYQNKHTLLKKLKKFNREYLRYFSFERKTKKWNSVFTILHIPCKFQQNQSKKVAVGLNGLIY
jgi:hypothetical protein